MPGNSDETVPIFSDLTEDQANSYGLVLTASGFSYFLMRKTFGWEIRVPLDQALLAHGAIERYLAENTEITMPEPEKFPEMKKTGSALWACLVLIAVFVAAQGDGGRELIDDFGASAAKIINGEYFRLVTALFLHADVQHLAGNLAGIGIFGTAVCSIIGDGLGWLLILATGFIGNWINAAIVPSDRISIGASTAVFGAVGLLTAIQFYRKLRVPGQRLKAWLPLAGGLALLAFLGAGIHSDITAHLFGFLAGIGIGLPYIRYAGTRAGDKIQNTAFWAMMLIVLSNWAWGQLTTG